MKKISAAVLSAFALSACSQDVTIEQNDRKAVIEGKKMELFEKGSKVSTLDNAGYDLDKQAQIFVKDGTIPSVPSETQSVWPFYGSTYTCGKGLRSAAAVFKVGNHYEITLKNGNATVLKYDGDVAKGDGVAKTREFCLTGQVLDLSQK